MATEAIMRPGNTLYIRNINEKVKVDELRTTLYHLASVYGEVIDINICKHKSITKMRGQAFIVYRTPKIALHALSNL